MLAGDTLRRSSDRFADKVAIIWEDVRLTYRELNIEANRFASALEAKGLSPGDHVAIVSRNRAEYAVAFFGAAKAGTVLVNISTQYTPEQFTYALKKADVRFLFVEEPFLEATAEARKEVKGAVVIGDDAPNSGESFAAFLDLATTDEEPKVALDEDDPFCMTFTGGTTGLPKGVLASHRNRAITAHTVAVEERLEDTDVVAIVTPMFHVAALNIMFQPAILMGATCVLQTKWSVPEFVDNVVSHNITAAFMVPTQALMLVSDGSVDFRTINSFRKVSFAGAPMPNWVQEELLEQMPNLKITQIYGQSEVGVICALPHRYLPQKLGSVGRQAYNVDIALLGSDGTPVAPGEIGELCSRGDNVMLGYYNDPGETNSFFRDGWGWTGDLARMDEDGFIFLVDRSKDMLISGGENVYPAEIENALYRHEAVGDCAVIGVPHSKWGEVPVAYVILRHNRDTTPDELMEHCQRSLTRFKVPHQIFIVQDLPKTPMAKVQKHLLRSEYLEDFGGVAPLLPGQADPDGGSATWGD